MIVVVVMEIVVVVIIKVVMVNTVVVTMIKNENFVEYRPTSYLSETREEVYCRLDT